MMQPYQQSSHGSNEKSPSSHSKQLLHHVLKNDLRITTDERVSFSKWMEYNHYHNTNELCEELFISWMLTRTKGNTFQLSSQYFVSLTYQDFNEFSQEKWIRMIKE